MTADHFMPERTYRDLLEAQWDRSRFVCVGLDPDWERIPRSVKRRIEAAGDDSRSVQARATVEFCTAIVTRTHDLVCAFKPNAAFFEALGSDGAWALACVVDHIREMAPAVPIIYDAKRGDIGSSNEGYARHAFDCLGVDAITVHPYLGQEALKPFLDRAGKGVIVLCRTSNPGGGEFQDLAFEGKPLYRIVGERIAGSWNRNGNCSVVVGATYPDELAEIRAVIGDLPILIPGIGAQGGDVARTVAGGRDSRGRGMVINSGRAIIFASARNDFAEAARREVVALGDEINRHRGASR